MNRVITTICAWEFSFKEYISFIRCFLKSTLCSQSNTCVKKHANNITFSSPENMKNVLIVLFCKYLNVILKSLNKTSDDCIKQSKITLFLTQNSLLRLY